MIKKKSVIKKKPKASGKQRPKPLISTAEKKALAKRFKSSSAGVLCAIMGCEVKPTGKCRACGYWYCNEHLKYHEPFVSKPK